jgi:hypothetical protein
MAFEPARDPHSRRITSLRCLLQVLMTLMLVYVVVLWKARRNLLLKQSHQQSIESKDSSLFLRQRELPQRKELLIKQSMVRETVAGNVSGVNGTANIQHDTTGKNQHTDSRRAISDGGRSMLQSWLLIVSALVVARLYCFITTIPYYEEHLFG